MGVKFGVEEGTFLHAKFHPHRCNVSPLRGQKPQNRPLSKLNTGRFALRAMLPVISRFGYRAALQRYREALIAMVCIGSLAVRPAALYLQHLVSRVVLHILRA